MLRAAPENAVQQRQCSPTATGLGGKRAEIAGVVADERRRVVVERRGDDASGGSRRDRPTALVDDFETAQGRRQRDASASAGRCRRCGRSRSSRSGPAVRGRNRCATPPGLNATRPRRSSALHRTTAVRPVLRRCGRFHADWTGSWSRRPGGVRRSHSTCWKAGVSMLSFAVGLCSPVSRDVSLNVPAG